MTPLEAETARLAVLFRAAGADPVAPSVLQPAGTLLDLYGEDIRARAYTTRDPARGELMLRPDFTVPVIEHHLATGRAAGRYTYSGPVFRMQEAPEPRPVGVSPGRDRMLRHRGGRGGKDRGRGDRADRRRARHAGDWCWRWAIPGC
jgi:histidyl-tRNA synthetase